MIEIKDVDKLLAPALGADKHVSSYKTRSLIGPGENYGSVMLALDVRVKNKANGSEEELNLVAKMCPPSEFIKKVFNTPVTFKKEAGFYSTIIPTLQNFEKERGAEVTFKFFPKYFGSRVSIDDNQNTVDDDACLVLENLKVKGYDTEDRLKGFDLKTAKYILKDLATLHAVPIAYKICNPEGFKKHIRPYLVSYIEKETISEEIIRGAEKTIIDSILKNKECAQYADRVTTLIKSSEESFTNVELLHGEEPFVSIMHNDFWVNNTMIKFDEKRNPISNAMVDFQLTMYGNPAHDLLFFIYTSLNSQIISEHYKELIDFYYENFMQVLKNLKVDSTPFSYANFLKEIDRSAKQYQCYHIMFMLKPIFTDKEKVKDLSDVNENEMSDTDSLSELFYPKLWSTVLDFVDKKWL